MGGAAGAMGGAGGAAGGAGGAIGGAGAAGGAAGGGIGAAGGGAGVGANAGALGALGGGCGVDGVIAWLTDGRIGDIDMLRVAREPAWIAPAGTIVALIWLSSTGGTANLVGSTGAR